MNAALTARLVGAGRIGFGVALILTPGRVTAPWLGRDADRAGARVLSRGLGARDLALGLGALGVSEAQLRPWVAAAIVADTADLVAAVAAATRCHSPAGCSWAPWRPGARSSARSPW